MYPGLSYIIGGWVFSIYDKKMHLIVVYKLGQFLFISPPPCPRHPLVLRIRGALNQLTAALMGA